jgi:serine/threonine protein kinase
MWQLLDAVRYMHRRSNIHRDLKLGNLFLTKDMNLKIGDFGLATNLKHDGERKKTICGTPNYIAPEILFDTQNGHSFEVDIWSLGVVMCVFLYYNARYTLLIGKPPFQTKDIKTIYKKIRDNSYEFPSTISLSDNAKSIVASLLITRPECRPSVDDVMQHPFFKVSPIIQSIPLSALHTAPRFDSDEDTLIDVSAANSSELRRTIRLDSVSPSVSKSSSQMMPGVSNPTENILKSVKTLDTRQNTKSTTESSNMLSPPQKMYVRFAYFKVAPTHV